jgi:CheY-like chemotaxis protein
MQPLTSIQSGIECIEETVSCIELQARANPKGEEATDRTLEHVAAVRACLKSMVGSNSFMTMCINRCLDYTKASKGVKLVPKPETVNLQEALDFPISIMRDVQTQLPITLAPVPAEICSHIITDKQWLMENVLCLLSNAVRYSQAGSVELRVLYQSSKASTAEGKKEVSASARFEVWDTGIGLTDEVMASLFSPFKQAQRLAGGTGLGLFSLAKRVEALRGEYGVCKRPDKLPGSMFWFSIPYRPDTLSAVSAIGVSTDFTAALTVDTNACEEMQPLISISPQSHFLYRVLVVDDAPSILKMTTMLLTKKGHSVDNAVNGAQAVDMVAPQDSAGGKYAVILMDLQMPVMDGPTAIRRIRAAEQKVFNRVGVDEGGDIECGERTWQQYQQNPRHHARPRRQLIIALSANSDSETMQEALDAGADHFMSKPFTYETFRELMRKHAEEYEVELLIARD